jgi:hypothetical protein
MRDWLTRNGVKCDVCGVEKRAPFAWLLEVLMAPHDVWAAVTGWHRRLGVLWDASYRVGVVHSMPWRGDR